MAASASSTAFNNALIVRTIVENLPPQDVITVQCVNPACCFAVQSNSQLKQRAFLLPSGQTEYFEWGWTNHSLRYASRIRDGLLRRRDAVLSSETVSWATSSMRIVELNTMILEIQPPPVERSGDWCSQPDCTACTFFHAIRSPIMVLRPEILAIDPSSAASCLDMFLTKPPVKKLKLRSLGARSVRIRDPIGITVRHVLNTVQNLGGNTDFKRLVKFPRDVTPVMLEEKEWIKSFGKEGLRCPYAEVFEEDNDVPEEDGREEDRMLDGRQREEKVARWEDGEMRVDDRFSDEESTLEARAGDLW